jgi:hypothetical protein
MVPRSRLLRAATTAAFALAVASGGAAATTGVAATDAPINGLTTDNRLLTFTADAPDELLGNVKIGGLRAGESLIGIDRRPLDGRLYAVGRVATGGWLYTIDPATGQATFVAALRQALSGQPVVLDGTEFGFDFNPAADALRIVSDTGQNLRVLPSDRIVAGVQRFTGDTFVDGALSRSPIGAMPRPVANGITAAAYTNNDVDPATGTTLYDIDTALDEMLIQNPPNDGTLTRVASLGRPTGPLAGSDIRTTPSGDVAYAALTRRAGNGTTLANLVIVDLATGTVIDLGEIGGPKTLRDIAAG